MMILPSKRGHLYVLERSRVYVRDGRIEYVSDDGRGAKGFNIPFANTMLLLLGPGSSITNEAVRLLKEERVCFGFCGSGGTPLLAADDEPYVIGPADEYREPSYLQRWVQIWLNEECRLDGAKRLLLLRSDAIDRCWNEATTDGPWPSLSARDLQSFRDEIGRANSTGQLLGIEGQLARKLYSKCAGPTGFHGFVREPRAKDQHLTPNKLLDHGNYLAYGLAGVVLWTLGIPSSLPLLHGKTRRGGLVFDLADVIKDAVVMPLAFNFGYRVQKGDALTETDFRSECIKAFDDLKVMDTLFNAMNDVLDNCSPCSS